MPSTAERLWETARTLPEPLLAEVLDFAEFLQARQARLQVEAREMALTQTERQASGFSPRFERSGRVGP